MYRNYLIRAIRLAKSQRKLSEKLQVSPSNINKWLNCRVNIPVEHALNIEVFSEGKIKAEKLAPYAKKQIQGYKRYLRQMYHHKTN